MQISHSLSPDKSEIAPTKTSRSPEPTKRRAENQEISKLKTKITLQQKSLREQENTIHSLESMLDELNKKQQRQIEETKYTRLDYDRVLKESKLNQARIEYLLIDKEKLDRENKKQKEYISKLEAKLSTIVRAGSPVHASSFNSGGGYYLDLRAKEQEQEIANLKQEIKILSSALNMCKEGAYDDKPRVLRELSEQRERCAQLKAQESESEKQLAAKAQEIQKLYTCIEEFKLIREQDAEELTKCEVVKQEMDEQVAKQEAQLSELQEEKQLLANQVEKLTVNLREITSDYNKLLERINNQIQTTDQNLVLRSNTKQNNSSEITL